MSADASGTRPTRQPVSSDLASTPLLGTVLAVQANFYLVKLDPIPSLPRSTLLCTRRSRLKKVGQKVMVGDRVQIEEPDWQGNRGAIAGILPRSADLDRPPVANADQILLVFALAEPNLDPHQLSRFLVKAESTELAVCLCLSKSDLVSDETRAAWQQRLQQWGYASVCISVRQSCGLESLFSQLSDRITVVSGPSGVGKSSLINVLVPQANLRVGEVSGKLARGRHTTRHVELFELPAGGLLADTPGFNQPELDCAPEELAHYFPEARQRLAETSCQFSDCLHRNEPGCGVRGDWERYEIYLLLLEEAIARQEALDRTRDEEASLKLKSRRDGHEIYEPKLELKKYRRQSRRSQQQELLTLQNEEEATPDRE
ncbi:MAG: small ribosomal subunit biogenesis GTPase RsgA [Leptolyngbyaceae cyanobacterium bins.349]|nr:small ribosomal subunit biogenesis GTPase RsgA [Leptolyngbyaceae cyanobacterium bins.349]